MALSRSRGLLPPSSSSSSSSLSGGRNEGPLSEDGIKALLSSSHVLLSIPPLGLPNYDPALQEQLRLMKDYRGRWVGYLSSTSVYGDWGGEWVDEQLTPKPQTAKGIQRRAAEEQWEQQDHLPLHIFRLGGIYGKGRSALDVARRQVGEELLTTRGSSSRRESKRFTSRIHVADICQALEVSMMRTDEELEGGRCQEVYNLVDDDPAPRNEVVNFALELIGKPFQVNPDSLGGQSLSERSSGAALHEREVEEKRVSNSKMKDLLRSSGLDLLYPSYKEGLRAINSSL